jgi:hypothetical protein
MTDLLRANAAELGVIATEAALKRVAAAARAQLAHDTARITLSNVERKPGRIAFDVRVENLTGHKVPSGYPSRRAWLYVDVRSGGKKLYVSGDTETSGQITGVADEHALPHYDRIERADQVQVYEMLACDESGKTTTSLVDMTRRTKDNRLLPRGWKPDGPHAADTSPVGTDGDDDFAAGSDTVSYDIPVPDSDAALLVVVSLRYQSIPPAWTKALANSKTPEAARFLAMYARAENEGEAVAFATVSLPAR